MRPAFFLALLSIIGLASAWITKSKDGKAYYDPSHIFDKNSEFMKGFETGILVRSKGGKMDEFGCKVMEAHEFEQIENLLTQVETALSAVSAVTG